MEKRVHDLRIVLSRKQSEIDKLVADQSRIKPLLHAVVDVRKRFLITRMNAALVVETIRARDIVAHFGNIRVDALVIEYT